MSAVRFTITVCTVWAATCAWADESAPEAPPAWEFALTAYPTVVPGRDNNYTSAIGTADRGVLHLEARYSYEAAGARSAFVGWNFSGGETLTWEITPLLGGVWGPFQAFVPGVELSLAYQRFDFYLEGEYVDDGDAPYTYAWSELGFAAQDWLRIGLAVQRTRIFGEERDIQRGPFAQVNRDRFSVGGYWFNPGADDQIFIGSIGVTF
ncbi:MAG: hypothetical protein GC183_06020 [Thiobacillus sp.]|nr:hypothetical protein [Thiobacillus sp.]